MISRSDVLCFQWSSLSVEKVPQVGFSQKKTQIYGYKWFTWGIVEGKVSREEKEDYKSVLIAIVMGN